MLCPFLSFDYMRMTVIWPDWNRLVQEGNAKAIGTPWTDEEWKILEAIQDEEERKQVVEELREGNYKPKKTEKSETKTETPKKDSSKEPKKTEKSE